MCVCAIITVVLGNRHEHIISRAVQLLGQDDIKSHFLGITKKTTAQPRYTLQRQQRYNSSGTAARTLRVLARVTSHGAFVCVHILFSRRCNRDYISRLRPNFKINHASSSLILLSCKQERLLALPLFNLRHPRDFGSTTSRRRTLYLMVYNILWPDIRID